jgi:hypothetical protein
MCDQGHTLLFDSKKCEIRKEVSEKIVATTIRTPNKIYILNEIGKESCFLGNENESWLWHRRMGQMNFENIVKIHRKEEVREIPEISKPSNNSWWMGGLIMSRPIRTMRMYPYDTTIYLVTKPW